MQKENTQLIQGGLLVTMNEKREVLVGDLRIKNGRIKEIASHLPPLPGEVITAARGNFVIPGLIQAHTHTCQALFRGLADDLSLLEWLKKKIWPLESAHNHASMTASAQIAMLEMQRLGTSSILDMGSSRHTSALFEVADQTQMRYWGGNCWADLKSSSGPIYLDTENCKRESLRLIEDWHHRSPLLEYVISPRFGLSCSEKILGWAVEMQQQGNFLIHTHASENRKEVELIKKRTGYSNVEYLFRLGLLNDRSILVHGVHLTSGEVRRMVKTKTKLVHCPSSNLKLASGIAPIEDYRSKGLVVGLGSDGAPCNNVMDPFMEMRLAALLQKTHFGPTALPAQAALEMATLAGAQILGRENELGSLEIGKLADVVIVDRNHPSTCTVENPYSALVYSCSGRDVQHLWINGKQVVKDFRSTILDQAEVTKKAKLELKTLLRRID